MENIIEQGGVAVNIENGIGTIRFWHPKSNSLPGKVLRQLANSITETGQNPEVKVVVLASEGNGAFCAGASFDELLQIEDFATGKEFFMGFARVINAIRLCPKFIIGRVHGKAVGGGVGVACAVDYCFATQQAAVKLSELAVGIGPFVVGPAVERKVGTSAFTQLTIQATEWQSAQWAREKGMFMEVFDLASDMDAAIHALATKLAASSPDAMKQLKSVMWEGCENWEQFLEKRAEMSGQLILSDFAKQCIEKIKNG